MSTRDQLIEITSTLIQEKGYYGTGLTEVIKEIGVPKGSLYHHFPNGKDELVAAALQHSASQRALQFKEAMKGKKTAIAGLRACVDVLMEELVDSDYKRACPLATVSLDISSMNSNLRDHCAAMFDMWTDSVQSYLEYKGEQNAAAIAEQFMIQIEGGMLLSKVHHSTKYLKTVKKQIPQLFTS